MVRNIVEWYAIFTRSQAERRVLDLLELRYFEAWLPMRQELHRWADRRKTVGVPIFPGYLFVRCNLHDKRARILATPGVVRILGRGNEPEPIPDAVIAALRTLAEHANDRVVVATKRPPALGKLVRVERGIFTGLEGYCRRIKHGTRIVIQVGALDRWLQVDVADVAEIAAKKAA